MCRDFSSSSTAHTFPHKEEILASAACYSGSLRASCHPPLSTEQLKLLTLKLLISMGNRETKKISPHFKYSSVGQGLRGLRFPGSWAPTQGFPEPLIWALVGERKRVTWDRGAKWEHTWKLLLPPIHTRLCQEHRLHQRTYWGGTGAQRGIMKVIPVCQRDSLQEDGWEGQ